MSYITRYRLP